MSREKISEKKLPKKTISTKKLFLIKKIPPTKITKKNSEKMFPKFYFPMTNFSKKIKIYRKFQKLSKKVDPKGIRISLNLRPP